MGRRLGQHFLKNSTILQRIAEAACPLREPVVVEIGPGGGALTEKLVSRAGRVIAVELDEVLAGRLRERFGDAVAVVSGDALDVDLNQWGPVVIAGNLPYYVATPIIEKVLAPGSKMIRGLFLVQREVAQRLAAAPESRDYGFLSVRTQFFADVEPLMVVRPGAFHPPPKVDSQVVRLTPVARDLGVDDPARFIEFAGLCFRQKRKTLRNNLAGSYPQAAQWPEASMRAEQLSLRQLVSVYNRIFTV